MLDFLFSKTCADSQWKQHEPFKEPDLKTREKVRNEKGRENASQPSKNIIMMYHMIYYMILCDMIYHIILF